jgi:hypothetical protein
MFEMHRVFCANSWELEAERRAFSDVLGDFNDTQAMPHGVLYIPVYVIRMPDKRPYQCDVEGNIGACRHYLLALSDDWGPPERNFQRDYELAAECRGNPALPMREIALIRKRSGSAARDASAPPSTAEFGSVDEFKEIVRGLLSAWLGTLLECR